MSILVRRLRSVVILSMIGGVMVELILSQSAFFQNGYFSIYSLERLKYLQVNEHKLFLYILQNRFQMVLFMIMACLIVQNVCVIYLFTIWLGFSLGIMAGVYVSHFGVKGILLLLGCILPQVIFYVPGFYGLLNLWCGEKSRGTLRFLKSLVFIGVVIIGIFLESYVNPIIVTKIVTIINFL